jgi:hypothetical protein
MTHFLYYNDNFDAVAGNPIGAEDFYGYLKSVWRNDVPMTYGGNGHGGGSGATADSTNYMFSGTPYGNGWNETAAGNLPDDRRLLTSSGPFYLPAHGKAALDFAYVFSRNESGPNGIATSIATNLHDVMRVKHWFDTDSFPCSNAAIGITENEKNPSGFSIFPNPAKDQFTIGSLEPGSYSGTTRTVEIFNTLGERVFNKQFSTRLKEIRISTGYLSSGRYDV